MVQFPSNQILEKKLIYLISMGVSGKSNVSCDRCLDKMVLYFNQSFRYIKFDHVEEEVIKDDVIFIPYENYEYNIAFVFMKISC